MKANLLLVVFGIIFCTNILNPTYSFCQKSIENQIASRAIEVKYDSLTDNVNLDFLNEKLNGKRILILGEAGHGDGATFKMKVKIIDYLSKNMGFKTLALEGSDPFSTFAALHSFGKDSLTKWVDTAGITGFWAFQWSYAKENEPLNDMFESGQIHPFGIDIIPCGVNGLYWFLMLKKLSDSLQVAAINPEEWAFVGKLHRQLFISSEYRFQKFDEDTINTYKNFIKKLIIEYGEKESIPKSLKDIVIVCLKNELAYVDERFLNFGTIFNDSAKVSDLNNIFYLNKRDSQMFNNMIWYLDNYPNEKVIIWEASYHGCRDLTGIKHSPDDSISYQKLWKNNGKYLSEKYKNTLYSMAFTSSEGEIGLCFDSLHLGNVALGLDSICIENELKKSKLKYGFIDFAALRNNDKFKDKKFYSMILGWDSKLGYWLPAFDGVFYIRKQNRAHLNWDWIPH